MGAKCVLNTRTITPTIIKLSDIHRVTVFEFLWKQQRHRGQNALQRVPYQTPHDLAWVSRAGDVHEHHPAPRRAAIVLL
jgi:hypothetical protein